MDKIKERNIKRKKEVAAEMHSCLKAKASPSVTATVFTDSPIRISNKMSSDFALFHDVCRSAWRLERRSKALRISTNLMMYPFLAQCKNAAGKQFDFKMKV
ncbi:hypothetical protein CEXT_780451 [Caerostris extrusa]|uniref:Uncharacterized protein n=1 Tax=Caerostris extrusa TaxID=172846 RepID=A0AAV4WS11_CAEEX|nr:hypothetical protein CEXT_780451 [Caerostris extrusa]